MSLHIEPPPCFGFLEAELIELAPGQARVRYIPSERMNNPYGIIQGGLIAGMLDNAIGPAVMSLEGHRKSSTIHMTLNFLRPVIAGESILAVARVIKHGRIQAYIEAEMIRERDEVLLLKATATNVFLPG